ncbi:putative retinol dehydrogenase 12 [Tricladium varicosporioides]|nr:putative retinol dehydrogenase 12 [Hymenoscyphus varicosporioides]
MADLVFDNRLKLASEKRTTFRAFLYRQFFVTPTLPRNVDLTGKTAVVTGSNTGIGLECARQLLDLRIGKLIIAVRDEAKGQAARTHLLSRRQLEDGAIEVWKLDMASYESVATFAERAKNLERLDIVILNAAIMRVVHALVASTNHEETLQVNFLSTALLTILLLPIFEARKPLEPGRIVWVQSDITSWTKFKEKDSTPLFPALDEPENFNFPDSYGTSKLLGQLFVTELTRLIPSSIAIITMPTPGLCYGTGLGALPQKTIGEVIGNFIKRILGRSSSLGARVITDGAVNHGSEGHGQLIEDCKIQPKVPFVYTAEGDRVTKILWEETMAELSFAKVQQILSDLRNEDS